MELELLKKKRQSDKEAHVNLTPIEQEIEQDRETWLGRVNIYLEGLIEKVKWIRKCSDTWHTITWLVTKYVT